MSFIRKLALTLHSVANHPLNRKAKAAAALRFCFVNAAVRMVPGDICVPFPNGTRLLISPRMKGAAHFINPGLCEFEEMSFVLHVLRENELFIDVGANVGAYTVLASGVARAHTIAFEPNPTTFGYLRRNIAINGLESLASAHNAGVGAAAGHLLLTDALGTENYVCEASSAVPTVRVPVEALDDVLQGQVPFLIKVDVEGYESAVFAGAKQMLRQPGLQAMIVERSGIGTRYQFDELALHRTIQAEGFAPCRYLPMERALERIAPEAEGNIIYVRNLGFTQDRLRQANAFQFGGVGI